MKRLLLPILLLLAASLACGGSSEPDPTSTPSESAWYGCTLFIQQQLGVSILDAQRYAPGNVTETAANEYRVDVHYADLGTTYRCDLLHRSDGNWELLGLQAR